MSTPRHAPLLIVEDDLALQKQLKWSLDRFESVTADDVASAVAIGRDDGGRTGQRKQLVLGTNKDAHAIRAVGAAEQVDNLPAGLQVVEQQPHALEVFRRIDPRCRRPIRDRNLTFLEAGSLESP